MMSVETIESGNKTIFKVEGRLSGAGVSTLEDCWRTAARRYPHGEVAIDLTQVTFIARAGALLLQLMDHEGVTFVTTGLMTEEVNEILKRMR